MSSKIAASEMKGCCGARSERKHMVVPSHFSHWPCRNYWWGPIGLQRVVRPLVKLAEARGAELDRTGGKGMRELERKAAGDERAFIPSRAPGWQIGRLRQHAGR